MKRQFSYSEYYLFNRSRDLYYKEYILGEKRESNEKMEIGTAVHEWLADPKYDIIERLKELGIRGDRMLACRKMMDKIEVKRLPESEVSLIAKMKDGTNLIAILDGLKRDDRELAEYKTTDQLDPDKRWKQWHVDNNEQLSVYAFAYKLAYHKFFRMIKLYELHTIKGTCKTFETVRGPKDLKDIQWKLEKCIREIKERGWWEQRKSRKEREQIRQKKLGI